MSLTAALLLLAACIADRPPEACDPADTTVPAETAETGDSGAPVVAGLDRSAEMTVCGPWSGVPDMTALVARYEHGEHWGGYPAATEQTLQWLGNPWDGYAATGGELLGQTWETAGEGAEGRLRRVRRRAFHCDEAGYSLEYEGWSLLQSQSDGSLDHTNYFGFLVCNSGRMLVIPRELELGTKWEAACSVTHAMTGSAYDVDFSCTYEVDEARDYTTPAGTFAARHVSVSGEFCRIILDEITWFSGPDGYWVGRGVGVLHSNSPQWPDLTLTEVH